MTDSEKIAAVTATLLGRNLVVDGSTHQEYSKAVYDSDPNIGCYPPYVVFDIDAQEFIGPEFGTREEAEQQLQEMLRSS